MISTVFQHGRRGFFRVLILSTFIGGTAMASPLAGPEDVPAAAHTTTQSAPAPGQGMNPAPAASGQAKPATSAALPPGRAAIPATGTVTHLAPIYVTVPTRAAQPVDTTATSTTVLTNDDLKNQNYSRVADALQSTPGIAVVTSGTPGQVTSVFTRGTNSDQTLLTIDGRRQAPDFTNFFDFTNLTLDNVDQVEVERTPASTLQGANAIGGVINVVTLSGRGVAPGGAVGFEGGSFNTFREFAQSQGSADDFDYGVAFSRQDSHFPRADSTYHNTVYRGNFGYAITPKIYVDVQTSYTTSFAGSPGIISFPDPTATLFRETWNISPRISAQVTDFYTTTFYYNRTQLRQVYSDPFNFEHNRSQTNTDAIDWQNDVQIARGWKITAGVQGDSSAFTDFDDLANVQDIDRDIRTIGGYVQSQWQPLTGLNILNSVRYDAFSQFNGAFSWRQAASYQTPVTATVLHASVASAYETPTVDDLYSPGFFGFGVGNPDLRPEKSLGWEFGAEQPFWDKKLSVSATYFHNHLTDLIEGAGFLFDPVNVGTATTEGAELGVTVHPYRQVSANINYTYLTAVDDDNDTRLLRRPRNSLNFITTYQPIDPVTISLGGSWVMGREDIDPYSSARVDAPDYFTLRGNVTWQINPHVAVWLRGENITGASYQPALGFPALGMGGYGGVKVSF